MIPKNQFLENDGLVPDFEEGVEPSKTYKLHLKNCHCAGTIDGIEAVKQAIFLMLSIERYDYPIYSWDYGVEFKDLFGKPPAYVASEVPRRIRECLLMDDRILEIDQFNVQIQKNKVYVTFVAHTVFGEVPLDWEVNLDGGTV